MSESFVTNTRSVVVNDIYTFKPTLINQFTFSFLNSGSNQLQGKNDRSRRPSASICRSTCRSGAIDVNVGGKFDLGSGYHYPIL